MKNLDWGSLKFAYTKTDAVVYSIFKDGKWGSPIVSDDFNLPLSCYAGVYHYGSSCFEGLKAFRGVDGKIRLFRPDQNAQRMQTSAKFLDLACPPEDLFVQMCVMSVQANSEYIPPVDTSAALYLRPLLMGINPQLGIRSSDDAMFIIMASPVGTYSGDLSLVPGKAVIGRNYDRAAHQGSGGVKIGANYAQSLHPYNLAHKQGYRELLFVDSKTNSMIEEFGSSNFFAIKNNTYITPSSPSVLPSITNACLRTVAADMGLKVERRDILVEELSEFEEVNSCGTAVVITPICSIDDKKVLEEETVQHRYTFGDGVHCGSTSEKLYNQIIGIQKGRIEDKYGWNLFIDIK